MLLGLRIQLFIKRLTLTQRQVYSSADILLLDDPLSALDHQTANHVVRTCLTGSLVQHRCVILVTHRVELCVDVATQVVEISDGKAHILRHNPSTVSRRQDFDPMSPSPRIQAPMTATQSSTASPVTEFLEQEYRAHGGVLMWVYWAYVRAGKLKWWAVLLCLLAVYRLVAVGETWFLKQWGEGEPTLNDFYPC